MGRDDDAWFPGAAQAFGQPTPLPRSNIQSAAAYPPRSRRTSSTIASSPSRSTNSDRDSWGPGSSVSSETSRPPWVPLIDWNQPTTFLPQAPFDHGYDLPCEQKYTGCRIRFSPEYFESWIDHSISHMGDRLPTRTVCTFCDKEFDCSVNQEQPIVNWRERMAHIGEHFYENRQLNRERETEHSRPDFHVLDHMKRAGLLSDEDYDDAIAYTERPKYPGSELRPPGFKCPENRAREEARVRVDRTMRAHHDLAREERLRRRGKSSGARQS